MNGDNTAWAGCVIHGGSVPPMVRILLNGDEFTVYDFDATTDKDPQGASPLASGPSSKKLTKWAMAHGAWLVRHAYDLQLEK